MIYKLHCKSDTRINYISKVIKCEIFNYSVLKYKYCNNHFISEKRRHELKNNGYHKIYNKKKLVVYTQTYLFDTKFKTNDDLIYNQLYNLLKYIIRDNNINDILDI